MASGTPLQGAELQRLAAPRMRPSARNILTSPYATGFLRWRGSQMTQTKGQENQKSHGRQRRSTALMSSLAIGCTQVSTCKCSGVGSMARDMASSWCSIRWVVAGARRMLPLQHSTKTQNQQSHTIFASEGRTSLTTIMKL